MKKFIIVSALLICSSILLNAQTVLVSPKNETVPRNYIKTNITSIFIHNYSIQYERALSKSISIALAYRYMPNGTLPLKDQILKRMESDDQTAIDAINNLTIGNYAITPEIRFYLGKKGYGRGFYIAPFYRYAKYSADNVAIDFETDQDQNRTIELSGNITAQSVGFMLGAQWSIAKYLCLDWWILGPHYGVSTGDMSGITSPALTTQEQADVRQSIEDMDIPMVKKTAEVSANKVAMIFDGPWAGLRAGISIGIRF